MMSGLRPDTGYDLCKNFHSDDGGTKRSHSAKGMNVEEQLQCWLARPADGSLNEVVGDKEFPMIP